LTGTDDAGRGLVVRPRDDVAPTGPLTGSGALPGSALTIDRVGQEGARRVVVSANFCGELAVGQVQRALTDQAERGRVPEGGGAAVAEDDLVAVGQ
jgi:hypothetical protein